ncbi:hypothetical protein WMY93_012041 [Mugilogobius chulae]|uniref:RING-type E3 ubiquitin transferase n=1 Tax=Mugilogobius chulae TaxID=88201 RepID=A0AAW0P4D1_9GOBI
MRSEACQMFEEFHVYVKCKRTTRTNVFFPCEEMAAPVNIQTPSKTWELSLYELHRSPQEAIVDGTEVAVSPRALHSELMCPICLDMLKDTMTTKECLHRFCSDCIVTALRSGNKECPTCRKKLVSRRSLRKDSNFDALISKIYPSRDEYEAHQRRVIERLNRLHNQEALSSSIEEGLRQQARYRAERNHRVKKPTHESDNTTFSGGEDNGDSRSHLSHDSAPPMPRPQSDTLRQKQVPAVKELECQTRVQGQRQTAAGPLLLRDATKTVQPQRSSLCLGHTHSWCSPMTTVKPGMLRRQPMPP